MGRRALLVAAAAVAVLGAGGYAASWALSGEDVPRGVRVGALDVGGLSRAVAAERVARAYDGLGPVSLVAGDEVLTLDPSAAGLRVDAEATVDEAASAGPMDRLRSLFGTRRVVDPVATVDGARLDAALAAAAKGFDRPAVEGAVRFTGTTPVGVPPVAGRTLDVAGARKEVLDAYPASLRVEVPVDVDETRTSAEDVEAVVDGIARPAVSGPITVDVQGKPLVVTPADIAKALVFTLDAGGSLAPDLRAEQLAAALGPRLKAVEQAGRDATFDVSSGKPVVVPSKDGLTVDRAQLQAAVAQQLRAPAPRRASVALRVTPPRVTTAIARTLGVKEVIGTFTTRFPCCRPRVTNIQTIADLVDGRVVLPGETYSLNGDVGRRDRARGFVSAPQIFKGQFVNDIGGGVSQFATTMYNATFFGGMVDVEHKPHSYYITRYPEGREATVSFPSPDLKWKNDSPTGVLVSTSYTGRSITVTLWGTKRYDEVLSLSSGRSRIRPFGTQYVTRADCTSAAGFVGFDITITRVMNKGGVEVRRDSYSHRYLPEPRFICGPKPR